MGRAAWTALDTRQLSLFPDPDARPDESTGWTARQRGRQELADFEQRLQAEAGLAAASAADLRRQLQAAIDAAGEPRPSTFVQQPDRVIAGIKRRSTRPARLTLHRTIKYFLELNAAQLPPNTGARLETALEAFPGRVVPKPHLVDRDLGGSVKRVRRAPPFTAVDAERLCHLVEETAPIRRCGRDGALVALHCWSGFAPGKFGELRWEAMLGALASEDRFPRVPTAIRGQPYPIVVDRRAVAALEAYWRRSGEPTRGPIFPHTNRSGRPTTTNHLGYVMGEYLAAAGLRGVDRRRLNAPFARLLLDQGWDAKAVAEAFGYQRLRSLQEKVRPLEEIRAQHQAGEWLTAKHPDAETTMGRGGPPSSAPTSAWRSPPALFVHPTALPPSAPAAPARSPSSPR